VLLPKFQTDVLEAGVDEAGRGCLAGPVVAAAVILPDDFYHPLLNDSKKMTEKNRELLQDVIKNEALAYCIAEASAEEIDQINILQATFLAMHRAIEGLKFKPGFLLQAQEFIKVCNNETSVILATTEDAFKALKTAELIIAKMNALNL
jgi:ribonuclease HII